MTRTSSAAGSPVLTVTVAASAPCSCNELSIGSATLRSAKYSLAPLWGRCLVDACAALNPPMIVAGHDTGRIVADGPRGAPLITLSIPEHARFVHVTPPVAVERKWRLHTGAHLSPAAVTARPR